MFIVMTDGASNTNSELGLISSHLTVSIVVVNESGPTVQTRV